MAQEQAQALLSAGQTLTPEMRQLKIEAAKEQLPAEMVQQIRAVWDEMASDEEKRLVPIQALRAVMTELGENTSREQLRKMMKKLDMNKTGSVSYEDFLM